MCERSLTVLKEKIGNSISATIKTHLGCLFLTSSYCLSTYSCVCVCVCLRGSCSLTSNLRGPTTSRIDDGARGNVSVDPAQPHVFSS